MTGATLIAAPAGIVTSGKPDPAKVYSCPECEHGLRVSGLGRHRLYFELDDEGSHDPVMNRVCPVCRHGLPGKSSS
jgi:hypothetical protein